MPACELLHCTESPSLLDEGAVAPQTAMTSSDDDDGRNGQRRRLLSTSPAPPVMSPLTPANGYDSASNHDNLNPNHGDAAPSDLPMQHSTPDPDAQLPQLPPASRSGDTALTQQTAAANSNSQAKPDSEFFTAPDPSTPFSNNHIDLFQQHAMPHNMSLMMALAQLSASRISTISTPGPPPTIAPAQVSLPTPLNEVGDPLAHGNGHHNGGASTAGAPLESFARIEFADSVFQMTTYAVIIGRDQRALEQARRDGRRTEEYQRRVDQNAAAGLPPPSPPSQERGKFSKSYVSEEGGMLGPESDGEDNPRPAKRRKTSTGDSASWPPQQQEAVAEEEGAGESDTNLIINRQYICHTPGAAAVDLTSLRPSPYHVPFIGIHSPGPNIASKTKAISREHLKIEFNQEKGVFEAIPLHKNGFFCEDIHYKETKVVLRSGDRLQIKDVDFVFIINGVQPGKTGAEEYFDEDEVANRKYSEGGKEMSFEFESSHGAEVQTSSDEEEEELEPPNQESDSELSDIGDEENENEVMETIEDDAAGREHKIKPEPQPELELPPPLPKKRGPGRPPKNGIMSKREERLRKKMAMELAKKTLPQPSLGEPPIKRKVGRPRKHPRPEDGTDKPDKRKYKPRKPKGGKDGAEGSDAEKAPKEKRREKPKTPPLELKKEDFTEEQLQKPNKNYGVLIDEVLTEAAGDGLTLKQIYKRIQKKYPYYFFVVDTKGWESSVRHNLIGNDAFKKNEETHLWSRVPGIELDAGKKRKATSPDQPPALHGFGQHYSSQMPHQAMYHAEHLAAQGYQPAAAMAPPGYQRSPPAQQAGSNPPQQQASYSGQHVGVPSQQPTRPAYQVPPQAPAPAPAQVSGYVPAAPPSLPRQLGAQSSSYSSPYAAKPPPPPVVPPNGAPGVAQKLALPAPAANSFGGLPRQTPPASVPGPSVSTPQAQQQQSATNVATAPLEPAVKPDVVSFINNFKKNVMEHLSKRTDQAEAVTLSVINRGLGLTNQSTVPDQEGIEKVVLGVFEQTRDKAYPSHVLPPGLVQVLTGFKTKWVDTLGTRLGKPKAEALLLSAIDRFLGFSEGTSLRGTDTEKKEYENAENMLIPQLSKDVTNYQRAVAAGRP
ncbi:hypothetical protein QBC33DRAFT_526686 [Phialemonium atrogriseum]|uniref:Fork-head domain-containing protein n=1 Tax=Phialemonium atrogriseum TaxID=1093897 RepID=A0AAJ0C6V0_9PEZI|nr:uncharacterized protein QBC33DRAFT_526686 [Phialemonium atrogriseum]KAK1771055.1 hypothetical protein QBC33DRAFT_526686 [Phialemonium atrogriseum]